MYKKCCTCKEIKDISMFKDNIIPICGSCNSSKCNKDFEEWYKTKDFYSEFRKQKIYEYLYKQANTVPSL